MLSARLHSNRGRLSSGAVHGLLGARILILAEGALVVK